MLKKVALQDLTPLTVWRSSNQSITLFSAIIMLLLLPVLNAYAADYVYEVTPGIPIVDNSCIDITINVSDSFQVEGVKVGLNIDHTWRADLDVSLTSPQGGGTAIDLFTDVGGNSNDFDILLDSDATDNITDITNPQNTAAPYYENIYSPENVSALTGFNGQGSLGDWILTICDDANGDSGTANRFLLSFNTPGINPLPAADTNSAPDICSASGADGLTSSQGVVNTYYPATASVAAGAASISLGPAIVDSSTTAIAVGDLVMIIQMQDADIVSSDDVQYGDGSGNGTPNASGSTTINQTGLYEFAIADSAIGTGGGTLALTTGLTHNYNHGTNKTFQVVRVPRYRNLTLSDNIQAAAWEGSAGGLVVLDVLKTLDLAGFTIDVAGSDIVGDPVGPGFRPGVYVGGDSGLESNVDPAYVAVGVGDGVNDLWGEKGEGIAGTPGITYLGSTALGYPNGNLARGAPGNGGGGGNDHNGGGGGGSNIGFGGQGGDGWSAATGAGGRGGASFNGYNGRMLLGGGGGAANANNNTVAGAGGSGGGLVFINAVTITGSGTVDVSGGRAVDSNVSYPQGNDGAGGGGGGGTIVIRTSSATIPGLTLDASGGDGGDVITASPHGPGGGGGGGAIYVDATVGSFDVKAGAAGIFCETVPGDPPPPCLDRGTHGALPGGDGHSSAIDPANMPVPIACEYPDETGYSSTTTVHQVDPAAGGVADLSIGSTVDYETAGTASADADFDDNTDTSGISAGNDENGVIFSSPGGTGQSIVADITVNNPAGATVTVCGWLDVPTTGGTVDGTYDISDGFCQTTTQTSGTVTFTWPGMPTDQPYTTFARFRITSDTLTTAGATGVASDGEVESYLINFDFTPTAVTIGKVGLSATRITVFLTVLGTEQMDRAALLALLKAWDPAAAAAQSEDASREEIFAALYNYLDPDGDDHVAIFSWDTLEERGTIGFYVDRRQDEDAWIRINNDMLPGLINAPMGGEYRLADPGVAKGTFQYQLIEQEARGTTRSYGPFEVELP